MPRPRFLSAEAEAEARRFAADAQAKRTHQKGPWGDRPSLRDIIAHLRERKLLPRDPGDPRRTLEPSRATVLRALGKVPHERRESSS